MKIYTVFFDTREAPQDFDTYKQAKEYSEERIRDGYANTYTIQEG